MYSAAQRRQPPSRTWRASVQRVLSNVGMEDTQRDHTPRRVASVLTEWSLLDRVFVRAVGHREMHSVLPLVFFHRHSKTVHDRMNGTSCVLLCVLGLLLIFMLLPSKCSHGDDCDCPYHARGPRRVSVADARTMRMASPIYVDDCVALYAARHPELSPDIARAKALDNTGPCRGLVGT